MTYIDGGTELCVKPLIFVCPLFSDFYKWSVNKS